MFGKTTVHIHHEVFEQATRQTEINKLTSKYSVSLKPHHNAMLCKGNWLDICSFRACLTKILLKRERSTGNYMECVAVDPTLTGNRTETEQTTEESADYTGKGSLNVHGHQGIPRAGAFKRHDPAASKWITTGHAQQSFKHEDSPVMNLQLEDSSRKGYYGLGKHTGYYYQIHPSTSQAHERKEKAPRQMYGDHMHKHAHGPMNESVIHEVPEDPNETQPDTDLHRLISRNRYLKDQDPALSVTEEHDDDDQVNSRPTSKKFDSCKLEKQFAGVHIDCNEELVGPKAPLLKAKTQNQTRLKETAIDVTSPSIPKVNMRKWSSAVGASTFIPPMSYRSLNGKLHVHAVVHDITMMEVGIIVNAANEKLEHVGGVAFAIAQAAGEELIDDCKTFIEVSKKINVTNHFLSKAGQLKCKRVMHVVGPLWNKFGDMRKHEKACDQLRATFMKCLDLADSMMWCRSIAIPPVSTGRWPRITFY